MNAASNIDLSAEDYVRQTTSKRIMVFDGGYGTAIQAYKLSEQDYRGDLDLPMDQKGNNDLLSITRPDIIKAVHSAYLDAGADIIETNSFSATKISMADYGCEHLVRDLNLQSAKIAREAAEDAAKKDGVRRLVAGSIGPTNKTLSLSPDVNDPGFREIDFDYLKGVYREQCDALIEGGVDFLLIETIFDTLNAKCAAMAAKEAADACGRNVPIMISMTITDMAGRNLSGHTVEGFWNAIRHIKPLTVGLNCSFGADLLRPFLTELSKNADTLIMAYPNAGLPNDLGEYDELPEQTAALISQWTKEGLVNIIGGCCGTTPAHIGAIAKRVKGEPPRTVPSLPIATRLSGLESFVMQA